jgi:hypothetical protein
MADIWEVIEKQHCHRNHYHAYWGGSVAIVDKGRSSIQLSPAVFKAMNNPANVILLKANHHLGIKPTTSQTTHSFKVSSSEDHVFHRISCSKAIQQLGLMAYQILIGSIQDGMFVINLEQPKNILKAVHNETQNTLIPS